MSREYAATEPMPETKSQEKEFKIVADALGIIRDGYYADSGLSDNDIMADIMRPTAEVEEMHTRLSGKPKMLGDRLYMHAVSTGESHDLYAVHEYAISLRDKQVTKFALLANINRYTKNEFGLVDEQDVATMRKLRGQYHYYAGVTGIEKATLLAGLTETDEDVDELRDLVKEELSHMEDKIPSGDLVGEIFPAIRCLYAATGAQEDFDLAMQAISKGEYSNSNGDATRVNNELFQFAYSAGEIEIARFAADRIYNKRIKADCLAKLGSIATN